MQTERFISVPEPTGKNDTRAGITMDPLQLGLVLGATLRYSGERKQSKASVSALQAHLAIPVCVSYC